MNSNWEPGNLSKKQKAKGKASANLDDVLGDLLGNEDPVPKSTLKGGRDSKPRNRSGDDDFYSSIAAAAGDDLTETDVSEADPGAMAKSLDDMDDLDASLFGTKKNNLKSSLRASRPATSPGTQKDTRKKSVTFSPPRTADVDTRDTKRDVDLGISDLGLDVPSVPKKSDLVKEEVRANIAKKKIDFGEIDEDDPLAGLLSDDDEEFPKKKKVTPKKPVQKQEPFEKPAYDKHEEPTRDVPMDVPKVEYPKVPVDDVASKPAPAAKKPPPKKDEILFDDDDDDVLGGMGFDDDRPKTKKKSVAIEDDDQPKGRSIMDDLLGKKLSVSKQLEPSSGKKEFVLDDKYKMQKEPAKKDAINLDDDEEFTFGSYRPSSAANSGGQSNRRQR